MTLTSFRIGYSAMQADFAASCFRTTNFDSDYSGPGIITASNYNLGAFVQLEKDTNSGLNDITQNAA